MFDADPTLKPRDIIVIVGEHQNAGPTTIQAVFYWPPGRRCLSHLLDLGSERRTKSPIRPRSCSWSRYRTRVV
ncbi:hypothetical protein OK016_13250 [Vibrio chagasii]|nr:hypothetical protein [Vibrio chagasii]